MIELRLAEIADIVSGTLNVHADPDAVVRAPLEWDSRAVRPGGLFLAVVGEHLDGHDYAQEAVAAGAVAVVATRELTVPAITVADPLRAIADLARAVSARLSATVVMITGSSGKTSTKDLLAQVLTTAGATIAPPGNFNNELGLPYTVLLADEKTRFLVLEAGARGIGHISYLTSIVAPDVAVVLNVGSAHVGEFGSAQAIAQAKGELVEALNPQGVAVLNADDQHVNAMAMRTTARVLRFGLDSQADLRAADVELDDGGHAGFQLKYQGRRAAVQLRVIGRHQVENALAAAAAATACGLELKQIADALSTATARARWRMELTERSDGVLVLNDAYNANPESMLAALQTLTHLAETRPGRGWAVLGTMAELGQSAQQAHRELGRRAAESAVDVLVAIGDQAVTIVTAAAEVTDWNGRAVPCADIGQAETLLRDHLSGGDVVLLKASRSAGLERIAATLLRDVCASDLEVPAGGVT